MSLRQILSRKVTRLLDLEQREALEIDLRSCARARGAVLGRSSEVLAMATMTTIVSDQRGRSVTRRRSLPGITRWRAAFHHRRLSRPRDYQVLSGMGFGQALGLLGQVDVGSRTEGDDVLLGEPGEELADFLPKLLS